MLLSGSGNLNRVNNSADLSLVGGTIQKVACVSEGSTSAIGPGSLSLSANSFIDFTNSVGTLIFTSFMLTVNREAVTVKW